MAKLALECKNLMVEQFKERLKGSANLFITSFQGLPVSGQDELRRKLKEIDASLFLMKNRLARRAFEQLKQKELNRILQGPAAIAAGGSDCIAISKVLVEFAKKNEGFKILGAFVDEQLLDLTSIKSLANVASKEVLIAQVIMGIKSPIHGLVNTLSATIRNIVVVLDKIREKKQPTMNNEQPTMN